MMVNFKGLSRMQCVEQGNENYKEFKREDF